jgi:predicted Fe-S protein YdhL (DUF1289 family)
VTTRDHIIRNTAGFVQQVLECDRKEAITWLAGRSPDERQFVLRMMRTRNVSRGRKARTRNSLHKEQA